MTNLNIGIFGRAGAGAHLFALLLCFAFVKESFPLNAAENFRGSYRSDSPLRTVSGEMANSLRLSIVLESGKYSGRGEFYVNGKIENYSEKALLTADIQWASAYLYKVERTKDGVVIYPTTYIAKYDLGRNLPSEIVRDTPVEFKVDLTSLGWDPGSASILTRKPFGDVVPGGEYHLILKILALDAEANANGVKPLEVVVSNSVNVEIKKPLISINRF